MQCIIQYRGIGRAVAAQYQASDHNCKSHEAEQNSNSDSEKQQDNPKASDDDGFIVQFDEDDKLNPHNWSYVRKWVYTIVIGLTSMVVTWASGIDSAVVKQGSEAFGVAEVTESLATGLYLVAFGTGALLTAPLSEHFGRSPVYLTTLALFLIFVMASGLAPNIGAQLAFRFLAGLFGSTPLTIFGGSVGDLWSPQQRTYVFPTISIFAYLGPFLAPLVGAYIGQSSLISWRWTEWITLIFGALVFSLQALVLPETYAPTILRWKARQVRKLTKDSRYHSEHEASEASFLSTFSQAVSRPFVLFSQEIMIVLFSLYLTAVYIVLFTFLTGYDFLFGDIYGFSQGKVGLSFLGMNIGFLLCLAAVPLFYSQYKKHLDERGALDESTNTKRIDPEERLWYAIVGAPFFPISLFWMAWTSYSSISVWSSLVASVFFGFSVLTSFISTYMYLIDSYEMYAASALVGCSFLRYVVSGGMVVASYPMYEGLGVHWTLTLLGCIALLVAPIPVLFYKFGPRIRQRSKYATKFGS